MPFHFSWKSFYLHDLVFSDSSRQKCLVLVFWMWTFFKANSCWVCKQPFSFACSVSAEALRAVCPAGGRGLCIQSHWEPRTRLHLRGSGQGNHPAAGRNRRQPRGEAGFPLRSTFSLCWLVPPCSTGQTGQPGHLAHPEQAPELLQTCEHPGQQEEPLRGLLPHHTEAEPPEEQRWGRAGQRGRCGGGKHQSSTCAGAGQRTQAERIRFWGAWGRGSLVKLKVTSIKSTL